MSYSVSTLLTRNLSDVFGENNPMRRRAAIDELYTEDVAITLRIPTPVASPPGRMGESHTEYWRELDC